MGGPGPQGQVKLAKPAPLAPAAQLRPERARPGEPAGHGESCHALKYYPRSPVIAIPWRELPTHGRTAQSAD